MMISVVMPVLNRERFVGSAIQSVISQDYDDWELIVVDSGSTDRTLEIVKQYASVEKRISVYVYEKRGEYPATNYGIRKAKGDIIGILHSDDMYPPNALSHVAERFSRINELDVLCPRVLIIADYGDRIEIEGEYQTDLSFEKLVFKMPIEPARFFRKRVFEIAGPIDDTYRLSGFREWWIKISLRPDVKWDITPRVCYIYRRHAQSLSSNFNNYTPLRYLPEHYRMIKKLLSLYPTNQQVANILKHRWLNDSITGFLLSLRAGRFGDALFYFVKGTEINHSYPFKLIKKKILDWLR